MQKRTKSELSIRCDELIDEIAIPHSAEKSWLVTVSGSTLQLWQLQTGTIYPELCHHSLSISRVSFAALDRFIVTGHVDGSLCAWDVCDIFNREPDIRPTFSRCLHSDAIKDMRVCHPSMPFLIWSCASDRICQLFDLSSKTIVNTLRFDTCPTSLCVSLSAIDLWVGLENGAIELRKRVHNPGAAEMKELETQGGMVATVTCLAVSVEYLVSGGLDKHIVIWSTTSGECLRAITLAGPINNIQFYQFDDTRDSRRLKLPALFNMPSEIDPQSARLVAFPCLCNFINAADRAIFPLAILQMSAMFDWSLAYQGWLLSSFSAGYIISQLLTDRLLRRTGASKLLLWAVLIWSLLFTAIPYAAFYQMASSPGKFGRRLKKLSLVSTLTSPMFLARLFLGLGEGFALPTIYQLYAQHLPSHVKARAFGYLSASATIGQTLAAIVTPHLPWQWLFFSFGAAGLVWSFLFARSRKRLFVDHRSSKHTSLPCPSTTPKITFRHELSLYLCNWSSWAIYIAHSSMNYSSYIIAVWFPTILTKHFHAGAKSLSLTALPFILNSLCGICAGHLADFIVTHQYLSQLAMRRTMTFIGLFFPGLLLLLFITVHRMASAVLLISLSMGLLAFNSVGHLSNHVDIAPSNAGLSFAISNTIATFPAILAGPLSAHLVSAAHGSWYPVFVLAALVNVVGALAYITKSNIEPI